MKRHKENFVLLETGNIRRSRKHGEDFFTFQTSRKCENEEREITLFCAKNARTNVRGKMYFKLHF